MHLKDGMWELKPVLAKDLMMVERVVYLLEPQEVHEKGTKRVLSEVSN